MNIVGYHECGIEAQSEMADDLIVIGLVLVFLQKIGSAGESDLVDVFFYLILCHAETVINEFQWSWHPDSPIDFDLCLVILRKGVLAHELPAFSAW